MISGGYDLVQGSRNSVQLFDPSRPGHVCSLPHMVYSRNDHAAAGLTVCGGSGVGGHTCETFNPDSGHWRVSHHLTHRRREHVMWESPEGPLVIGGSSQNTVEKLRYDGTTKETFPLLYSIE